ncbi:MAG: bifunctional 3-(3-hydroxy-phenyl)propionate/3-hydroxycinnamic acid hydroxylase [Pigmentiphaga sp.]|uniref:bifunctional 3-(3-hydroxy-phenyl)propionate/3-hydroxycinnamic acid hydroxylase MhpA n=1 Tax=Pigmentiphaga sp. TaxID=1977564 RepID=UPI003B560BF0
METLRADVAIVGYGPVGRMQAIVLAEKGHHVVVVDRQKSCYPLPRAVCMDHEVFRAMHAHGCGGDIGSYSAPSPRYQWFGQDWSKLLDIDWTIESVSGGPEAHFFYQPALEAALETRIKELGTVKVLTEHEALALTQDKDGVELQLSDRQSGTARRVQARYLVGADGANSMVRKALNIGWKDLGFKADFLVVDLALNEGVELDIPPAGQFCNTERPTTFVPGGIKDGRVLRRWEFMLMPHETKEDFESEESVWKLLSRWVKPDQGEFLRHAIYTFRSLVAERWRDGRVFLAGDSAHLTPPFLGQGMCSGMRDAINLGWRLDLLLRNAASDELLQGYEEERKPHITQLIEIAMYLGKIICVADPQQAAERDRAFLDGTAPPPPELPYLRQGTVQPDSAVAGRLSPHADVVACEGVVRLDDFTGPFFVLVARSRDALEAMVPRHRDLMQRLNVKALYLSSGLEASTRGIGDVTGKLGCFLDDHAIDAYLVRPDGYLFGSIPRGGALTDMLDALGKSIPPAVFSHGDARLAPAR